MKDINHAYLIPVFQTLVEEICMRSFYQQLKISK